VNIPKWGGRRHLRSDETGRLPPRHSSSTVTVRLMVDGHGNQPDPSRLLPRFAWTIAAAVLLASAFAAAYTARIVRSRSAKDRPPSVPFQCSSRPARADCRHRRAACRRRSGPGRPSHHYSPIGTIRLLNSTRPFTLSECCLCYSPCTGGNSAQMGELLTFRNVCNTVLWCSDLTKSGVGDYKLPPSQRHAVRSIAMSSTNKLP